ncbi:MAG TPA: hypothetical protein VNI54_17275 [Thermoanaerobaculia bacterium]|nr:hypothetical protein [Thermoanaerobaculia bacterium]
MIATVFLVVAGLGLALRGGQRRIATVLGEAYLLGAGVASLVLLAFSMAGVPWSRGALLGAVAVVAAASLIGARRSITVPPPTRWNAVDLFTLALVAGYSRLALFSMPIEVDYIFMWGVKAKKFFHARGVDWSYLENPVNIGSHPDYPQLVPFVFDVHALLSGAWDDRWLGAVNVAFGVAALLIVRDVLVEELGQPWAVVTCAAIMPLVFSPYMGMAEAALIAYSLTGLLYLRRGNTGRAALFLGLGAFTKNEGLALIVAAGLALAAVRRWRELPKLALAFLIPLPWLILRAVHDMPTDLMESGILQRFLAKIADPSPILEAMSRHPAGNIWFWGGTVVVLLLCHRRILGAERFLTVTIAVQFAFLVAAYFVTPKDIEWHVRWSWERVIRQLMPLVALLAVFAGRDFLPARTSSSEADDAHGASEPASGRRSTSPQAPEVASQAE